MKFVIETYPNISTNSISKFLCFRSYKHGDRNLNNNNNNNNNHNSVTLLNLNSVNQLILVMVKCGVLFEVRTAFLNNI
jgi:hypothetical protein